MTIREEIKLIFAEHGISINTNEEKVNVLTDDILKLFEKLINSKLAKKETSYDQTQILLELKEELKK